MLDEPCHRRLSIFGGSSGTLPHVSPKCTGLEEQLARYISAVTATEPDILRDLREETQARSDARMQISPEQGQFMRLLVELIGAKRCLEIGVYTGYSSTCVALSLPEDGLLVACDISDETTAVARRYWQRAGVLGKVQLTLGPALDTLRARLADGEAGTFDFAFIDADKSSYDSYYEACLELLRRGGLIAIDNALWGGRVIQADADDPDTRAIRALNQKLMRDPRVSASLVPIGDGVYLARKR